MKSTELINKGIENRLDSLWTAIPAKVVSINYSTLTCSVQPKVKLQNTSSEELEDLPIVQDVPIACQKSGDSVLLMPPEVGDTILIMFTKYALDNLLKDYQTSYPNNIRRFSINDCIVVGGLHTSIDTVPTIASEETMLYHKSGAYIKIDSDGDITIHGKTVNFTKLV
ncbi:MAG: hypothetical protein KAJ93_07220 [Methanosarcinales archaeon]|nr:hypothetical protein [Methanosarcinales archaeon]